MERYTVQQVQEQKERFDSFMNSTNLVKIGKAIINLMANESGIYNRFNYTYRVLKMANIQHCMYDPKEMKFYNEILTRRAIDAYLGK